MQFAEKDMIRATLDHNVFISALLKRDSKARQIVNAWLSDSFTLVTSQSQIDDLLVVAARSRFRLLIESEDRFSLFVMLQGQAEVAIVTVQIKLCRDPEDDVLLEIAASNHVQYLVTGDKDLLEDNNLKSTMLEEHGVQIVNPNEFLAVLEAQE